MHTHTAFLRALRLCDPIPQSWAAVHVAGTNGKGSICQYIGHAVKACGVRCGTFTSPHIINRWDSIRINGTPVSETRFNAVHNHFFTRSRNEGINSSPFELLTATAFQIFEDEKVEAGIVETGMGGRYDATNVLKQKAVNVISHIGLDHREHLGNTVADIALQKCGIFMPNVPIVFDYRNSAEVLRILRHQAQQSRSRSLRADFVYDREFPPTYTNFLPPSGTSPDPETLDFPGPEHQRNNARIAFFAAHTLMCALGRKPGRHADDTMLQAIAAARVPGRMQEADLKGLTSVSVPALLDGAHNALAVNEVEEAMRAWAVRTAGVPNTGITWIMAVSDENKVADVVIPLLREGDTLFAVEFGPVDGMEWRTPYPADSIRRQVVEYASSVNLPIQALSGSLQDAMRFAETRYTETSDPVIVTGSLYLVSDVLRALGVEKARRTFPKSRKRRGRLIKKIRSDGPAQEIEKTRSDGPAQEMRIVKIRT